MRADIITPSLPVKRGQPIEVELEVVNTTDVIDHITCLLPEQSGWQISQYPKDMTLFPGERAAVSMTIHVPESYSAGEHELLVRAQGEASGQAAEQSLTLDIEPVTKPRMRVSPGIVTGGRKARFNIDCSNDGNTPITLVLQATDSESRLKFLMEPAEITLAPGESGCARLTAKRARPLTGSIESRDIQIAGECLPEFISTDVVFRQKPIFPPGFITSLTLAFIIALWAVAIMFGVRAALKTEPPKKTVPITFAAGLDPAALDASIVGADVAGKVTAATTGLPLARITVELFDGKGVRAAAGATKDDGTFALPGVLPGAYTMRYRAAGFAERWYPATADQASAQAIQVIAATPLQNLAGSVSGMPGSLEGVVLAGDGEATPVDVSLTPVDLLPDAVPVEIPSQHVNAGATYRFTDLPTPGTYRVRISGPGFQPQEVQQFVPAGTATVLNTVRLAAGDGAISGLVTDDAGNPLGEVNVSSVLAGEPVATVTPTAGAVGQFSLAGLASPASYVVTFAREGYGTEVVAVPVAPGQLRAGVNVVLSPSGGTATGFVRAADGTPLGDAEVTVVGSATPLSARTFTSGQVGGFRLSNLTVPGTYTLAVSKPGFASETMRVSVSKDAPSTIADVVLTRAFGTVRGTIRDGNGLALGAANVLLTDGVAVRTTTSASAPVDKLGTFELVDVPPGTYTVTISSTTCVCGSVIRLVTVTAGAALQADATLGALS
jgi:Carboxypeptidase regulatory-like domain